MPFSLKIKLKSDEDEYIFDVQADVRKWLPGEHKESIHIELPADIKPGKYSIEAGIISDIFPVIYLATDAERDGGYYKLADIEIN